MMSSSHKPGKLFSAQIPLGTSMRLFVATLLLAGFTLVRAEAADPSVALTPRASDRGSSIVVNPSSVDWCQWIVDTPNFRIYWCPPTGDVRSFAAKCERLAAVSRRRWLGKESAQRWSPKCDVVVHRGVAEYVASLGPGGQATSGCATIRLDEGRVVLRRIDLRVDATDWIAESLPHELMHVVLADRFSFRRIPPWADEGIAMLSESPARLNQRLHALRQCTARGSLYTFQDLIRVETGLQPAARDAFYGQSLALVSVLLEWGTRKQVLDFVAASQLDGYDAALRQVYGTRAPNELERQFAERSQSERPFALAHQTLVASSRSAKAVIAE
jgi:hypothetical protein